jgi:hypothetical protein
MSGYSIGTDQVAERIDEIAWYLASGREGLLITDDNGGSYTVDDLLEGPAIRELEHKLRAATDALAEKRRREIEELHRAHDEAVWALAHGPDNAELVAKYDAEPHWTNPSWRGYGEPGRQSPHWLLRAVAGDPEVLRFASDEDDAGEPGGQ